MPPRIRQVRGALAPDDAARVGALAAAAQAHDGVEALGEQALLDLTSGAPVRHLLASGRAPDGPSRGLLGYAQLAAAGGGAELVVSPDARQQGVGRALLTALLAAATAPLQVWAHGDLPGARALARSAGLEPVRELWRMGLDLTGPEAPSGPPTVVLVLRPARPEDDAAWLALNAAAFAWHPEQGRMSLADLDARRAEPWFDPDDLLVVEADGRLLASLWLKVPDSSTGEIYVLAVHPDAQGRGLGRALTSHALAELRRRGVRRAVLFTEADNHPAVAVYRRAGFEVDRADVGYARAEPRAGSDADGPHRSAEDATMPA